MVLESEEYTNKIDHITMIMLMIMTILVTCHIGLTFQKFGHIMSDACPTVIPSTFFQQPQPGKACTGY